VTDIRTPTDLWLAPAAGTHGHRGAVTRSPGWYFPRQGGVKRHFKRGDVVPAEFIDAYLGSPTIDAAGFLVDSTPYGDVLDSVIAGHAGHPAAAVEADPSEYTGNDKGEAWVTIRKAGKDGRATVESVRVKSAKEARQKGAPV